MIRAKFISLKGEWQAVPADSIRLDLADRHRRRIVMRSAGGVAFLLDLPMAAMLRDGDALVLDDGRLIEIVAAPETLSEFRVGGAIQLARLAWHLGNRHLPVQILDGRIRIRHDAVIDDMARRIGAEVARVDAAFDPELSDNMAAHSHDPLIKARA